MTPRNTSRPLLILAVSVLVSCTPAANPLAPAPRPTGDGFLTIRTESGHYTWTDSLPTTSGIIRAIVTNRSDHLFRATLGDGFNSAVEQEFLFVADGSDGFLEQWLPPSQWKALQRPPLIEGLRRIEIRPHSSYNLAVLAVGARPQGVFRVRVQYFDAAEAAHQDYSNTFTLD